MEQQASITASQPRVSVKHPALAMTSMLIGAFVGMFSENVFKHRLTQFDG